MISQYIENYAEIAVKLGLNVQKGQQVVVHAPIEAAEFVRNFSKKAYEVGAKNVRVFWSDQALERIHFDLAPDEAFTEFPNWLAKGYEAMVDEKSAFLSIVMSNPDLMKGVDPKRLAESAKARGKALDNYRQAAQSNKVSWCVLGYPSQEWADKVFPDAPKEERFEKLWFAILDATRATLDNPIGAWEEHSATLHQKGSSLNEKKYKALHFQAPGTDLTIELPPTHLWAGGSEKNEDGVPFVANIPTEEVFTLPLKEGANGYVTSTKPLVYQGNIINNFTLTFEKGKVVDVKAEEDLEILQDLIASDEGASYLGEVALVPHESPISQSNLTFYNTLYDENASVHLAIGSAYPVCIENGSEMSAEELKAHGVNTSIVHTDFMIGSADMNIDGITAEGTKEPLFRNGNWAV
ncbi:aminopeptidase [Priestia taiwanensis]|uniref:Aminopeptidase n=1 Tax=Priestia taiwanensis TaxID=1347902 RepID=A0A917EPU2_9BACI|nr:aminopeptidase [Priestia taiwanensis]MBM7363928.1 aminopeptidase [Priestia taiwanensis]GGE70216.1 aminopeptidase [Priestia taiwanensis]